MEGKLIKREKEYYALYNNEGIFISDINGGSVANRLSIKNCEAVVNGYDLDELANRAFHYMGYHSTVTPHEEKQFKLGYNIAFREALEILGDKKFSEEDMWNMFYFGDSLKNKIKSGKIENKHMGEIFDDYIKSLQQTQCDVEIEIECVMGCQNLILNGENSVCCGNKKPKLDTDGCLILKRK